MKSSILNNRLIAILTFIAAINSSTAQQATCFSPSGDFKELQRKFQDWKSGVNLNEKKGWKSFKHRTEPRALLPRGPQSGWNGGRAVCGGVRKWHWRVIPESILNTC